MDLKAEFDKLKKVIETLADKVVFHTEVEKAEVAGVIADIGSTIEDAKTAAVSPVDVAPPVEDDEVDPATDAAVVDPLAGYTLDQLQAEIAARSAT